MYLTYIIIGALLSEALPFFHILGVTPLIFFCALFVEYFGFRKILTIYITYHIFYIVRTFTWFNDFVISTVGIAQSMTPFNPFFYYPPYFYVATSFFIMTLQHILMVWLIHKALVKIGIYKRIQF